MSWEDLLFWRRHKTLERGDEKVVINYNRITGKWRDAGYFRKGKLLDTTTDPFVLKAWLETDQ